MGLSSRTHPCQLYHFSAPWVGKKLAFHGSYATELPAPFLEDGLADSVTGTEWFGYMCAARRLFWDHYNFTSPVTTKDKSQMYVEAARSYMDGAEIPNARRKELDLELRHDYLFPKEHVWVLRNLRTREVVSFKPALSDDEEEHSIGIDDILLMRICWTDPRHGDGDLARGPWAGHMFDIVTMDAHQNEMKGEEAEWSDVTEVAIAEARALRARLGHD